MGGGGSVGVGGTKRQLSVNWTTMVADAAVMAGVTVGGAVATAKGYNDGSWQWLQ